MTLAGAWSVGQLVSWSAACTAIRHARIGRLATTNIVLPKTCYSGCPLRSYFLERLQYEYFFVVLTLFAKNASF